MAPAGGCVDATAFTHKFLRFTLFGCLAAFFDGVVKRAVDVGLTSDEYFSANGTLIESHARTKRLRSIDQINEQSKDDPDRGDGNVCTPA